LPRKPHAIAHVNVRLREHLRAKLAREAERHQTSLNNEIRIRLEKSFEVEAQNDIDSIARHLESAWARLSGTLSHLGLAGGLVEALEQGKDDEEIGKIVRAMREITKATKRLTDKAEQQS
jgi:hypothetical protein